MKIAYFSPLNPQKSGISDYSEHLLTELKKHVSIDIWVAGFVPNNQDILNNFQIIDYVSNPFALEILNDYDEIIYNIGNNPYYHSHIYDVMLKYKGIVILHEYVLYFLVTGYILDHHHNEQMYLDELQMNHGELGYLEGQKILKSSTPPLQYNIPEKLPLNKRLIDSAKGIIVHSKFAQAEVLKINEAVPCIVIGHIVPNAIDNILNPKRVEELRKKYEIRENELIIASFGYVAHSKRIHQVIKALTELKLDNYKYLLVGEGDYVKNLIKKHKLQDKVIITGFTTIEEFDDLIAISDLVINLRFPYMGETSGSLIRALFFGKASIVSDIGWFAELPDDAVIKVPVDNDEIFNLKKNLEKLLNNKIFRNELESEAKNYADKFLKPEVIVGNIVRFLRELDKSGIPANPIFEQCDYISKILIEIGFKEEHNEEYIVEVSKKIHELYKRNN